MSTSETHARYTGALEPTEYIVSDSQTQISSRELDPLLNHSWADDPDVPLPPILTDGTVVNERYRIESLLGSGGMGAVYRATQLDTGTIVAIKIMLPRLASKANARLRFQREARAISRMSHPNVVAILDHGEMPPHVPYLVMDFLDGLSLRELMLSGESLPWYRALEITRGILQGLGHAHECGVIHRDIKPENVFMARHENEPPQPRLLDLGLAKLVTTDDDSTPHKLTMRGAVFGTPAYMAPEQALGEEVDVPADIYSTTVMLYELLTGERPFYARDPPALLIMHTRRRPPPLAKQAPYLAEFPPLQKLIDRGLAKPPSQRFPSAAAFIEAIDDTLAQLAPMRGLTPDESAVLTASSTTLDSIGDSQPTLATGNLPRPKPDARPSGLAPVVFVTVAAIVAILAVGAMLLSS